MPADLPHGLRVQIQSTNIHPHELLNNLRTLFRKLGIHTSYLADVHHWSRLLDLAFYVRIDRHTSETTIVDRNGLLERLARFSSTRSGIGE